MRLPIPVRAVAQVAAVCLGLLATSATSHLGRVDQNGCHQDRSARKNHCHPERSHARAPRFDPENPPRPGDEGVFHGPLVHVQAFFESGRSLDWQIETSDGLTGKFALNYNQFDLSAGNVFVVSIAQDPPGIRQFRRDLSGVKPENESIIEFGLNDPDIAKIIQSADLKSYTTGAFGLEFQYPFSWFGPEEYVSDQNLRVEVGSDKVYPYGTDRTEQIFETRNSYYVLIQFSKNDQNQVSIDTYQSLLNLQDGESLSDATSLPPPKERPSRKPFRRVFWSRTSSGHIVRRRAGKPCAMCLPCNRSRMDKFGT